MIVPGRITFLGTGTSHGIPMIGCTCAVCRSTDARDRRLRPSIYVDVPGHAKVLVDTSTDLRQQALTHGITEVDAVLFTHGHADHVMGLDELRRFNVRREEPIPAYAAPETWASLRRSFYYVFDGVERRGGGVPRIQPIEIAGPFTVGAVRVVPIRLWHGDAPILGFRLGQFAYLTDCSRIPDDSWPLLEGVRTLVVDALRHRPHTTHFTVAEALEVVARVAPADAWLTHMCHDLGHDETNRVLPPDVQLAYDGLMLDVGVEIV